MKQKNNFLSRNLFLICSLMWYAAGVISFFCGSSSWILWGCLGSLYLCLYAVQVNKRNHEKLKEDGKGKM